MYMCTCVCTWMVGARGGGRATVRYVLTYFVLGVGLAVGAEEL